MDYPDEIDEYELMYGDEMDMANEAEYQPGKNGFQIPIPIEIH